MLYAKLFFLLIFVKGVVLTPRSDSGRFYDDDTDGCDATNCAAPNCTCYGKWTPGGLSLRNVPQFVMLTFDGPVTASTVEIFRKIMCQEMEGPHPPDMMHCPPRYMSMCPPSATFFVSHEYSDYTMIHTLYNQGNEIAVQSISRESDTDMWKNADETRWKDEIVGMKKILANFSQIPESNIIGFRAPFLQTAGDTTFKVLAENGFVYDSSMPTTHNEPPLWPYTLDFGFPQDCHNKPCPEKKYPGQWVFPMVRWKRTSPSGEVSYCSMIDSCTPQPTTKADTYHFLMENFNRHYHTNKAPFPIFLHESWLRESGGRNSSRLEGFIQFFEEILRDMNVFVVPMKGVLHYMRHPMPIHETGPVICGGMQMEPAPPCEEHQFCWYPDTDKHMKTCVPCPKNYPWVGNPEGN